MSGGNTGSDLVGLSLAAIVFSLSWPAARIYFKQWTRVQTLEFFAAVVLCIVVALLWIPLAELLTVRNAAGQASSSAAGSAALVMLGWTAFAVLWLTRFCVRILPAPTGRPKLPNWLTHFGVADGVFLLMAATGVGIMLVLRYG